jgi:hypothetical protein
MRIQFTPSAYASEKNLSGPQVRTGGCDQERVYIGCIPVQYIYRLQSEGLIDNTIVNL